MFDRISDGVSSAFRKLSGQATISESNVREAMDEVRTALLEADVQIDVADEFCQGVISDAVGREVAKSLEPGQEMIGIVNRRLIDLLGGDPNAKSEQQLAAEAMIAGSIPGQKPGAKATPPLIRKTPGGPTVIMMCGLQGSGKTTTCGKLAGYLKKRGRTVMLAAADLQRPAAVEQLQIVSQGAGELPGGATVTFYGEPDKVGAYGEKVGVAVDVCKRAYKAAKEAGVDVLILDTAGRLHVNDELMGELHAVAKALKPEHVFLVVDAMTGQDAVNSAKAFHERLAVDGVILTKFDSDTRGGAALSVKKVTGATIKFIGVGEKLDALEEFHAERMAGRILGMGDVVSLVEKVQEEVSEEEAEAMQAKMAKGEMTMDDFLKQMKSLRRMGSMKSLLGMLPGVGSMMKDVDIDEKQLDRTEAMIKSMTADERAKPDLINVSRRKRIARGSGGDQQDVGKLVKQVGMVNNLTKRMGGMGGGKMAAAQQMAESGNLAGMAGLMGGKGSTRAKSRGTKSRKKRR